MEMTPPPRDSPASDASKPSIIARVLPHSATILAVLAAVVYFAGHGYYDEFFRQFGLRSSVLELGQLDVAVMGFYATLWSFWKTFLQMLQSALYEIPIVAAIVAALLLGIRSGRLSETIASRLDRLATFSGRFGWWAVAVALVCAVLAAGPSAGRHDADSISRTAIKSPLCYDVAGTTERGRMIGQGPKITVIKRASDTVLVATDEIGHVFDCPRKSPGQAGAS